MLARRWAYALVWLAFAASAGFFENPAGAFTNSVPLADPALEARARELTRELRCLVCQNQSIAESDATLADDMRQLVRERIAAGDSDAEVREFFVARYGEWILLEPPLQSKTVLLWLGPAAILALGGGGAFFYLRRQRRFAKVDAALSAEEAARLSRLLERDRAEG